MNLLPRKDALHRGLYPSEGTSANRVGASPRVRPGPHVNHPPTSEYPGGGRQDTPLPDFLPHGQRAFHYIQIHIL